MKYITQILVLCFCLSFAHSQTSTCFTGVATDDTSQDVFPNSFEENPCPTDNGPQSCLRAETVVNTQLSRTNVNVTFGICANDTTCMADCATLIPLLIQQTLGATSGPRGITLGQLPYGAVNCVRACCRTDNCNDQSVQTILQTQEATLPPEMTNAAEATAFVEATTGGAEDLLKTKQYLLVLFVLLSFFFGNIVS